MKNVWICLIFPFLGLTACEDDEILYSNGNIVEQEIEVPAFQKIFTAIRSDVIYKYGAEHKVKVRVSENLLPYVWTNVKSGLWTILLPLEL